MPSTRLNQCRSSVSSFALITLKIEDRVRQLPNPTVTNLPPRSNTVIERKNSITKLDAEMKELEDSIQRIDEQNKIQLSIKNKSKNGMAVSQTVNHGLNTHREERFTPSTSYLLGESNLDSKSLLDIKTKSKFLDNSYDYTPNTKRRPNSSKSKRGNKINTVTTLNRPVVGGEILMKLKVTITTDSVITVNIYKGDTSYTAADRCITQHLAKIKVSLKILKLASVKIL